MAVVKLNRAIQYRAYPTEAQAVLLAKTFGCVRFAWNRMLIKPGRENPRLQSWDERR